MSYWYQGVWHHSPSLQIAYDDPALIYGASVFTTCRVYGRSIDHPHTCWPAHRQRLQQSLQDLGWLAPDWDRVSTGLQVLAHQQPILRVTLFPDGRELIWGRELPVDLASRQQVGIVATIVAGYTRSLPQHKTGNYLAPWLARQQSHQEAILVNSTGEWLETSTGNLWGWQGNCWYTPPLSAGILPGISRAYLVQWLRAQGKIVNEDPWDSSLVNRLTGLAYSNTVVQFVPIHTVIVPKSPNLTEERLFAIDQQVLAPIWQAFSDPV